MTEPSKNQLTPPELETFLAGLHKVHSRDDQHVTEPHIVVHSTDAYWLHRRTDRKPLTHRTTALSSPPAESRTAGFASQTSIHPPRFLVGLSRRNRTFRVAADATHLGVHVFDRQHCDVVELFGGRTGDKVDKFEHCAWHLGPQQTPVLDAAAAWFVGEIVDRFPLGDHVGHLLAPVAGERPHELEQWVSFGDVHDLQPGHEA